MTFCSCTVLSCLYYSMNTSIKNVNLPKCFEHFQGTPSPGISNNEIKRNLVKKITVWHPCPFLPLEKWLPCPFHCATVECRNLESNLVNFRMSRMWYCKIINHQGKLCEKDARSYALLFSICKIQHFII